MANTILIMGESGGGKTTSLRNLDPASTLIIDADGKGLAWRGWRKAYNPENKNYLACNDKQKILAYMKVINGDEHYAHIKTLVIDTLNAVMLADERSRKDEKSYDKWSDLAWSIFDILEYALTMRDDLTVIFTAHTQTEREDDGYRFTRMKTSGRKLDKIVPESKVRTVLLAKCMDGEYVFETRGDASTAKDGMFGELSERIPNDIVPVIEALMAFDAGEVDDAEQSD